jgi:hypothetical protein
MKLRNSRSSAYRTRYRSTNKYIYIQNVILRAPVPKLYSGWVKSFFAGIKVAEMKWIIPFNTYITLKQSPMKLTTIVGFTPYRIGLKYYNINKTE